MAPAHPRYAGPPPPCPASLDAPPPDLTPEQLRVPTSELYSVALASAWRDHHRPPTPDQVERLEPRPDHPCRPRPTHYGPYAVQRASIDWDYHVVPTRDRQRLQDEIVTLVLEQRLRECQDAGDDEPCRVSEGKEGFREQEERDGDGKVRRVRSDEMGRKEGDDRPLALFTAGGMGAGKGHTLKELLRTRQVRLPANTVWIDPDALSRLLPERPQYVRADPATASALLHPEASLLQEVCAAVAREQRRSLVVDGSLTDCEWYEGFMRKYREAGYDCEILFVSAPEDDMLHRAAKRAQATGRVTNPEAIRSSRVKSPECVAALSKPGLVRRVRLIDNSSDTAATHRGPRTMYDSARDPDWPACPQTHAEGGGLDARGFVEGRLEQGEDGRARRVRSARAQMENGQNGEGGKL